MTDKQQQLGPNQIKWIEALESGKYKQVKGELREVINRLDTDKREYGFCCLGVGCDISGLGKWKEPVDGEYHGGTIFLEEGAECDITCDLEFSAVQAWLGLNEEGGKAIDVDGDFNNQGYNESNPLNSLTNMNDGGSKTFEEIAAHLRANVSSYFYESK